MLKTSKQNELKLQSFPAWSIVAYIVLISLAVDAALFLSLAGSLSWVYSVGAIFSAALLIACILFTMLEISKLNTSRSSR